jgi:hypothetical protein
MMGPSYTMQDHNAQLRQSPQKLDVCDCYATGDILSQPESGLSEMITATVK